jgi:hypothetical protein
MTAHDWTVEVTFQISEQEAAQIASGVAVVPPQSRVGLIVRCWRCGEAHPGGPECSDDMGSVRPRSQREQRGE